MRWVADAKLKAGVLAAIRDRAPASLVRRISPLLLLQLPKPLPLILSGTNDETFGPAELQSLRRTNSGAIRFAPSIVVGAARGDVNDWLAAGALPVRHEHSPERQVDVIEEALRESPPWVVSTVYIGPCRRHRRPLVLLHARRATDQKQAVKRMRADALGDISPAMLPRLHRRMMCAVVSIDTAPVEQRRDFIDIVADLETAARASGDPGLYTPAQRLMAEARRLLPPHRFDRAAFDRAVQDVVSRLNERAAAA